MSRGALFSSLAPFAADDDKAAAVFVVVVVTDVALLRSAASSTRLDDVATRLGTLAMIEINGLCEEVGEDAE